MGVRLGGRKKGVPNRATAAKAAEIAASGLTPLDYMLAVMRADDLPLMTRLEAAKSAAPYVHPKLATIEHTGKDGTPLAPLLDGFDLARRVAWMLEHGSAPEELQDKLNS